MALLYFIQLVVINWLLGFIYDHFLNKNVYACGYKMFPLVLEVTKICHLFASLTCHIFMTSQTRGNILCTTAPHCSKTRKVLKKIGQRLYAPK